jgi:hypothetical protein
VAVAVAAVVAAPDPAGVAAVADRSRKICSSSPGLLHSRPFFDRLLKPPGMRGVTIRRNRAVVRSIKN